MLGVMLALVVVIALGLPLVWERWQARKLADERRRRGMVLPAPLPPPPVVVEPPDVQVVTDEEWRLVSRAVDGPRIERSGTGGGAARKMRRAAVKRARKTAQREVRAALRAA